MTSSKYKCRQLVWVVSRDSSVFTGNIQSVIKTQTYDPKDWGSETGYTETEKYDILLGNGDIVKGVHVDCIFDNKNDAALFLFDKLNK